MERVSEAVQGSLKNSYVKADWHATRIFLDPKKITEDYVHTLRQAHPEPDRGLGYHHASDGLAPQGILP